MTASPSGGRQALSVTNLTKIYHLYDRPSDRLKEALGLSRKSRHRDLYALNDVSFSVQQGETVGIIGTNGSGKSTILKIITGVLTPTSGEVKVNGRISALLELGAGFNMEYTGLENIYLNGTMMGFTREEIDARMNSILSFADIGDFVNQPCKTYSSGMFVRLAFAVAINIDPEILIVDEALSVGDVFFQSKCYHKFEEFKAQGKTILFVSHDLSSISKYCDRVVLLNKGVKRAEGEPREMVDLYKKLLVNLDPGDGPGTSAAGGGNAGTGANAGAGGSAGTGANAGAGGSAGTSANADFGGHAGSGGGDGAGAGENTVPGGSEYPGGHRAAGGNGSAGGYRAAGGEGAGGTFEGSVGTTQDASSPLAGGDSSSRGAGLPAQNSLTGVLRRNPNTIEYGEGQASFVRIRIYDERGNETGTIEKGTFFTIRVTVRFNSTVDDPIVAYTFKNLQGTEITGTNTWYEDKAPGHKDGGDVITVSFRQKMNLQGGEYLISFGCTGYHEGQFRVFHRLYDIVGITVISTKNTVGYYDMDSEVTIEAM